MPKITKQTNRSRPSVGVLGGIVSVADLPETGFKFLVYGRSGTGKTTLACSFPKPLLLIRPEAVEDGSLSVRTVKGVDATPYLEDSDQLNSISDYQRLERPYKTLVLDGVGKFQDLVLKKVLGLKKMPEQLGWGVANQQDWGTVASELKEHLRQLLRLADLGTNVVIIGGERALNVEEESRLLAPSVMVALTPSSMGWLHEVCDYNVHAFLQRAVTEKKVKVGGKEVIRQIPGNRIEYCLRVGPDDVYQTKFRMPRGHVLPDIMVDGDYAKIHRLIQGG